MTELEAALLEWSARQMRTMDDKKFLRKAERVRALPGTHFQRYVRRSKNVWFKTHSSGEHESTAGQIHTQRIKLEDVTRFIREPGATRMSAARRATTEGDIRVWCSCPAYKYWGFQYIDTQQQAAIRKEDRYPMVRNPRLRGTVCKHLHQALQVLPFNAPKIAKEFGIRRSRETGLPVNEHTRQMDRVAALSAYLHGLCSFEEAFDPDLFAALTEDDMRLLISVPPLPEKPPATERAGTFSFSNTQVQLPTEMAEWVIEYSLNLPDGIIHQDAGGRENDPHVTVKFGLHTTDPAPVADVVRDFGAVTATLGRIHRFDAPEYDVLYIDVDSNDLRRLNALISNNLDVTDTHPVYKPHVTIAYLKKGEAVPYLNDDEFEGVEIVFDSIKFSTPSGRKTDIDLGIAKEDRLTLGEAAELHEIFNKAADWTWVNSLGDVKDAYVVPEGGTGDNSLSYLAARIWRRLGGRSDAAMFAVNGVNFVVSFDPEDEIPGNSYDVTFAGESKPGTADIRYDDTGALRGSAPQVLGTVAAIVKDFIKRYKPDALSFVGSDNDRTRIYGKMARLMKKAMDRIGYEFVEFGGKLHISDKSFTDKFTADDPYGDYEPPENDPLVNDANQIQRLSGYLYALVPHDAIHHLSQRGMGILHRGLMFDHDHTLYAERDEAQSAWNRLGTQDTEKSNKAAILRLEFGDEQPSRSTVNDPTTMIGEVFHNTRGAARSQYGRILDGTIGLQGREPAAQIAPRSDEWYELKTASRRLEKKVQAESENNLYFIVRDDSISEIVRTDTVKKDQVVKGGASLGDAAIALRSLKSSVLQPQRRQGRLFFIFAAELDPQQQERVFKPAGDNVTTGQVTGDVPGPFMVWNSVSGSWDKATRLFPSGSDNVIDSNIKMYGEGRLVEDAVNLMELFDRATDWAWIDSERDARRFIFMDREPEGTGYDEMIMGTLEFAWSRRAKTAMFMLRDVWYLVKIEPQGDRRWDLMFQSETGPTSGQFVFSDTGRMGASASLVLGTVVDIIKDFVRREKPNAISFIGSDDKRTNLYKKMARLMGKAIERIGYEFVRYKGKLNVADKKYADQIRQSQQQDVEPDSPVVTRRYDDEGHMISGDDALIDSYIQRSVREGGGYLYAIVRKDDLKQIHNYAPLRPDMLRRARDRRLYVTYRFANHAYNAMSSGLRNQSKILRFKIGEPSGLGLRRRDILKAAVTPGDTSDALELETGLDLPGRDPQVDMGRRSDDWLPLHDAVSAFDNESVVATRQTFFGIVNADKIQAIARRGYLKPDDVVRGVGSLGDAEIAQRSLHSNTLRRSRGMGQKFLLVAVKMGREDVQAVWPDSNQTIVSIRDPLHGELWVWEPNDYKWRKFYEVFNKGDSEQIVSMAHNVIGERRALADEAVRLMESVNHRGQASCTVSTSTSQQI